MRSGKIIIKILLLSIFVILIYTYIYLPLENKGEINVESSLKTNILKNETIDNSKSTFINTEYKIENNNGEIFTTKSKESYIFQNNPSIIYLIEPSSSTILKKDQSKIEINSLKGIYNKNDKTIKYEKNVIIKNKNYIINAEIAEHFSQKNLIKIQGNVIMKDTTNGLSHIIYCDIVDINTLTNDVRALMFSKNKKVIAKKFK